MIFLKITPDAAYTRWRFSSESTVALYTRAGVGFFTTDVRYTRHSRRQIPTVVRDAGQNLEYFQLLYVTTVTPGDKFRLLYVTTVTPGDKFRLLYVTTVTPGNKFRLLYVTTVTPGDKFRLLYVTSIAIFFRFLPSRCTRTTACDFFEPV